MNSWSDITAQVDNLIDHGFKEIAALNQIRHDSIASLAKYRNRSVICYYSGWLQLPPPFPAQVGIIDDDMNGLMNAVHGLDKEKGLDLVLHTPGGDLAATQAIVNYLMDYFDKNVEAFVPQLSMSAGTMIACACKRVYMGRHSSLGPTDPQLRGIAASGVIEEFETAIEAVKANPNTAPIWTQIIGQYLPTFLGDCQKVVKFSEQTVKQWLINNMLSDRDNPLSDADNIISQLCDHKQSAMHNRHYSYKELQDFGMEITLLEDDDELQNKVLAVHHSYMAIFQRVPIIKIIENNDSKSWVVSPLDE